MTRTPAATNAPISPKERFRIMQRLEDSLEVDGEYMKYKHDLSDAKLAEECKVSETTMKLIRREVFGNLRRGGGASPLQILFEKHSALEAHVAALEKRILALEDYITRTGKAAYGSSQTALPVKPNTVNSFSDLGRIIEKSNG